MNSQNFTQIPVVMTEPHTCNYLPEQTAHSIFIAPDYPVSNTMHSILLRHGFRRSGDYLYKPSCQKCHACLSSRIVCRDFELTRRLKRIQKKNLDLTTQLHPSSFSDEYFDLYFRYLAHRHQDGGMYPPSIQQFQSFLLSEWCDTRFIEFRLQQRLIAVSVVDFVDDGLSALYTFFDPDFEQRSLGALAILSQIQLCKDNHLDYVYLGYWIEQCQKMRYKQEYQPLELFVDPHWKPYSTVLNNE